MKLQVMICTFGAEGLERVARMELPQVEGVGYLVSCQMPPGHTPDVPEGLLREDIEIYFTPTIGLSINRNHALEHVTAHYALVADDDMNYYAEGLRALIRAFDQHPEMDIALLRVDFPFERTYPPEERVLPRPYPRHNAMSVEMALRMESVRRMDLRFSPLLGIGASYLTCGEEDMLVYNARCRGAHVRFMPLTVGQHPQMLSQHRGVCPEGAVRANGAVIALQYPGTAALRIPLTAWRLQGGFLRNLRLLLQGARYALNHKSQLL